MQVINDACALGNTIVELPLEPKLDRDLLKPCEQCDRPFSPRSGSGGEKQRFCCGECRSAFHAAHRDNSHRGNADDCHRNGATVATVGTETPDTATAKPESVATVADPDRFDWDGADTIIRTQPAIAVYFNKFDALVIQQESISGEDDAFIFVNPENIDAFIDKLTDAIGIPSVGRRS